MDELLSPLKGAGFVLIEKDTLSEGYSHERWSFPGGGFKASIDVFKDVCYSGRIFCKGGAMHIGGNTQTGHEADSGKILEFIKAHSVEK